MPYLLAVAMASNVGSTATITGNPQNIMIGSFSHIPYTKFLLALGPIAVVGLVITVLLVALFHRDGFANATRLRRRSRTSVNRALVIRALVATAVMIALFFAGIVPAKAAIIIGGLLLLTRRLKSRKVSRGDRLGAAADVRWLVHYCGRRRASAPHARTHRCRKRAAPG